MFDALYLRVFRFFLHHKKAVLGFVILASLAAGAGLFLTRYDGSIDSMLPPDKDTRRSLNFLRDSNLSDKIIVSLALIDPGKTKQDLFSAADRLAATLTPPLFMNVVSGLDISSAMDEFSVLRYAPQVLGEDDLKVLDSRINRQAVSRAMGDVYRQSLRLESIFTSSQSRTDPIGIRQLLREKMKALPDSLGYDVSVEDGHFVSSDGRHTMLIARTSVAATDGRGSKEMIAALEERLKELPAYVSADIIGAHVHTVGNERVIIRDITVASLVASAAFFLLFLLVFRDARALLVFLLPMVAVMWAVVLLGFFQDTLSYLVVGFGTAIVGISDYGLIVYIAMRRGADASQNVKLARLVIIDAVTTIFSFVVLFFSRIQGYHQLALFAILCLAICLLFSLFVLPLALTGRSHPLAQDPTIGDRLRRFRRPAKLIAGVWLVTTVFFLILGSSVRLDSDVKKLDGSGPDVQRAERNFRAVWGGKAGQAILVTTGKSLDEAMAANDRVYREAAALVGKDELTSLAVFWPSESTRKENRERWDRFWKQGREAKLKGLIRETAGVYGFSERAFSPFFEGLAPQGRGEDQPGGIIARLQERFVTEKNGEYRVMSFFPDEQRHFDALAGLVKKHPGTFIVSGRALSSSISAFTARELYILAPLAVLFNIVLARLFFGNWKETLIALVPLVTGVAWLLGIMAMFNMTLNVVSIVAGIIASGVIVDYGLGITYEYGRNLHFGTVMAMTLSAASNVIGAGALLFAQHPALFSTGVAMVVSMITGYIASMMVVPSLCTLLGTAPDEGQA